MTDIDKLVEAINQLTHQVTRLAWAVEANTEIPEAFENAPCRCCGSRLVPENEAVCFACGTRKPEPEREGPFDG